LSEAKYMQVPRHVYIIGIFQNFLFINCPEPGKMEEYIATSFGVISFD